MCEAINRLDVYRKADVAKVLFAEDFVSHILVHFQLPRMLSIFGDSRPVAYKAFNRTVETATDYLCRVLDKYNLRDFEKIYKQGPLSRDSFLNYATFLKRDFYSKGIHTGYNAKKLLHLCVKISVMAARFVLHRIYEGPVLAVKCILSLLDDPELNASLWDSVNLEASTYVCDEGVVCLSTSDSEFGTESELSDTTEESDSPKASCSPNLSVQETDEHDIKNEGEEKTFDSAIELQASNSLEEMHSEASCSSLSETVRIHDYLIRTRKRQ